MAQLAVADVDAVLFQTTLCVQVGDVNYGGQLANDAVLRLCHEVRMRWLAGLGWSEPDAGGAGLIMADAAVQYLAQGFYGDELSAEMGVEDIGKGGFALLFRLTRIADGKVLVLARARTGMVCFDYARQKVCRLPEALKTVLEVV